MELPLEMKKVVNLVYDADIDCQIQCFNVTWPGCGKEAPTRRT